MTTKTPRPSADKLKRAQFLYYDIETVPDPDIPVDLVDDIIGNVKVRKMKDPEKEAEALEEKKQKALDEFSLSPLTNRIICIAFAFDDEKPRAVYGKNEKELLAKFIEITTKAHDEAMPIASRTVPVTFNGLSFDQHVLFMKIAQHGLPTPRFSLRVPRYDKGDLHVDLRMILGNGDKFARGTLGQWAVRLGYQGEALEHDGSEIRSLFEKEDWGAIRSKCKTDVELVRFIHHRFERYI